MMFSDHAMSKLTSCDQLVYLVTFRSNRVINRIFYLADTKIIEVDFHHGTCHFPFYFKLCMHPKMWLKASVPKFIKKTYFDQSNVIKF